IDFSYNYIYVVADDGNVYLSTDRGSSWLLRSDIGGQTDYQDITLIIIPEFSESVAILLIILAFCVATRQFSKQRRRQSRGRRIKLSMTLPN
ncbi:MAG: hypothetical protein V3U09_07785, partial [Thermoplasmata archaeon]